MRVLHQNMNNSFLMITNSTLGTFGFYLIINLDNDDNDIALKTCSLIVV